jgi:hypothetical protein
MAELTEVATEAVAEAAETVAEGATSMAEVSRRLSGRDIRLVLAGVGVGGIAVGVAAAFIQDKRLRKQYAEQAEDQMREHFRAREIAREEKPSLDELQEVVDEAGYTNPNKVKPTPVVYGEDPIAADAETVRSLGGDVETHNVFEDQVAVPTEGGWDYATELAHRLDNRKQPYVIHIDEHGELDNTETTFTYYEGDDVVCDEEDRIITNPEGIIGVDFREKFGHGSGDLNTVYIRNDEISADVEVCSTPGMYSIEVQGLNPDTDEDPRSRRVDFDDDD